MIDIWKLVTFLTISSLSAAVSPPPCDSKPCVNGGNCITRIDESKDSTYICDCPPDYVGETCEYRRCDEASNFCFNGGTCVYDPTWPQSNYCECEENFFGDRCENWIIVTDFDSYFNMTPSRDVHFAEYCDQGNAHVKQRYAFIRTGENLNLWNPNNRIGRDGKEFCLSFSYNVNSPDAELYVAIGDFYSGNPGLPGHAYKKLWQYERSSNNYQKWVYFRDTFVGYISLLFEIRGRIPSNSTGSLAIDQIIVVKGECKGYLYNN